MRNKSSVRLGITDIWNAFMCDEAKWSQNDIPLCPTILTKIPSRIITWVEAKAIYKRRIKQDKSFRDESFVCFYLDDQKFDGNRAGIWAQPHHSLEILSHFCRHSYSRFFDIPRVSISIKIIQYLPNARLWLLVW